MEKEISDPGQVPRPQGEPRVSELNALGIGHPRDLGDAQRLKELLPRESEGLCPVSFCRMAARRWDAPLF